MKTSCNYLKIRLICDIIVFFCSFKTPRNYIFDFGAHYPLFILLILIENSHSCRFIYFSNFAGNVFTKISEIAIAQRQWQ